MIRMRTVIFFATAASGWTAMALAEPAASTEMAGPSPATCETPALLPEALSGWSEPATPLTAATRPEKANKARLEMGAASPVTLSQTPSVRYAVQPSKPGGTVSFGGLLSFEVPESGTYRVAQDGPTWVDVIEAGKVVESVAHGHGPECSGIAKMVDFKLNAGRHLLQISANGTQALKVMVQRAPVRAPGALVLSIAALALVAGTAVAQGRLPAALWNLPAFVAPPQVPADNPMSDSKIALGRRLFHDADLSINGTMSCATCHDPAKSFQDGNRAHPGAHGEPGLRNVPSLVNVALLSPLTWGDSGLRTLEAQAMVPIAGEDPVEMGMKGQEAELARRLSANPCYRRLFRKAFPDTKGRIDFASVTQALAAFQRTIVSYDTPWDHAREGGPALPAEAARGETVFAAACAACHVGPQFTDMQFHRLADSGQGAADTGLARITGRTEDADLFRTPSLRNVMLTAPYLHDGSADTLPDAIARHGIDVTPTQRSDILAFLGALTDRAVIANPRLTLPGPRCETGQ